jgi:hypothetical protein
MSDWGIARAMTSIVPACIVPTSGTVFGRSARSALRSSGQGDGVSAQVDFRRNGASRRAHAKVESKALSERRNALIHALLGPPVLAHQAGHRDGLT